MPITFIFVSFPEEPDDGSHATIHGLDAVKTKVETSLDGHAGHCARVKSYFTAGM
jgi:hypothetical protein